MKPYYEEDGITIYRGDCREILPSLDPVDLVLTDPPYGIKVDSTMAKQSGQQFGRAAAPKSFYDPTNWDATPVERHLLDLAISKAHRAIVWGGNYFGLPGSPCWLVWDKVNGTNGFADCELAWTNLDGAARMFRWMWNGMLRENDEPRNGHPTQKPLGLFKWCLAFAEGDILDPFMGSGTTLRAAKDLGRKAIGIEIEEKYCEIAAKRLAQKVLTFG